MFPATEIENGTILGVGDEQRERAWPEGSGQWAE